MSANRTTILLAVLVAVLIVALFWFLIYTPQQDRLAQLSDEIAAVQAQQDQARIRIAQLAEVRRQAPEIEASVTRVEELIPSQVLLPSALRQLQLAADDAGADLVSVTPSRPVEGTLADGTVADVAQIPISLSIDGDYYQLVDFLRRVEEPTITPRAITWNAAALTPREAGAEEGAAEPGTAEPTAAATGEREGLTMTLTGEMYADVEVVAVELEEPAPSPSEDGTEGDTGDGTGTPEAPGAPATPAEPTTTDATEASP